MTYREQLNELVTEYRRDWQDDASCKGLDPDIWFLDRVQSARTAKRICSDCPVRIECLVFALSNNERFGVWGGMTEAERKKIRRAEQMPLDVPVDLEIEG